MTERAQSFESAFERLSEIVGLLESGESGLEESLKLYSEGMKLAKFCGEKLSEAEKTIERLTADLTRAQETGPEEAGEKVAPGDDLPF